MSTSTPLGAANIAARVLQTFGAPVLDEDFANSKSQGRTSTAVVASPVSSFNPWQRPCALDVWLIVVKCVYCQLIGIVRDS
jgi:hypothetical protein